MCTFVQVVANILTLAESVCFPDIFWEFIVQEYVFFLHLSSDLE